MPQPLPAPGTDAHPHEAGGEHEPAEQDGGAALREHDAPQRDAPEKREAPALRLHRGKVEARRDAHGDDAADVVVHPPARRQIPAVDALRPDDAGQEVDAHHLEDDPEADEEKEREKIFLLRAAEIHRVEKEEIESAEGGDLHEPEEGRSARIEGTEQPPEDIGDPQRQKAEGEFGEAPPLPPRGRKTQQMDGAHRDRRGSDGEDDDELRAEGGIIERRLPVVRGGIVFGRDGHVGAAEERHEGQRVLRKEERREPEQEIEIKDGKLQRKDVRAHHERHDERLIPHRTEKALQGTDEFVVPQRGAAFVDHILSPGRSGRPVSIIVRPDGLVKCFGTIVTDRASRGRARSWRRPDRAPLF